jgi:hypothetical protein
MFWTARLPLRPCLEWSDIITRSPQSELCTEDMESEQWWAKLRQVVELAKPVAEAIVQLQGDTPKLSSVLPMFQSLRAMLRLGKCWYLLRFQRVSCCAEVCQLHLTW